MRLIEEKMKHIETDVEDLLRQVEKTIASQTASLEARVSMPVRDSLYGASPEGHPKSCCNLS
jgi:hypothetical protein